MKTEWNEKASQSVAKKMERMKEELGGQAVDKDSIVEVLERLHPEVSSETLHNSVQEIHTGMEQIYQTETKSAAQTLAAQMEGMTEEQKKGFLCQLFDSIKLSDEAMDSEIENVEADSTDLAQMSMEELQTLVSEQLVNSINGMAGNTLENNIEEIDGMEVITLRTEEDALLLAAAQYSEALEGNIPFEYTKIPRVLGQCAAAQVRIVKYCEGMAQSELSEDEKCNKIVEFIVGVLALLVCVAFSVVFGLAVAEVAGALMVVTFDAVAALLGTGIIAFIAELILVYPIMWVSFAAAAGAGALIYLAGKGVYELFKMAAPKIKQFYGKLVLWLRGEKRSEEDFDNSDAIWDYDDSEGEELEEENSEEEDSEEDLEENDNLAYT